jgi:hypothetical protein
MIKQEGMANVRVVLFGTTGPGSPAVARRPAVDPRAGSVERDADDEFTGSTQRQPREYRDRRYWVQRHDGSRFYYDRDRGFYRPPPSPFYGPPRPWGWN